MFLLTDLQPKPKQWQLDSRFKRIRGAHSERYRIVTCPVKGIKQSPVKWYRNGIHLREDTLASAAYQGPGLYHCLLYKQRLLKSTVYINVTRDYSVPSVWFGEDILYNMRLPNLPIACMESLTARVVVDADIDGIESTTIDDNDKPRTNDNDERYIDDDDDDNPPQDVFDNDGVFKNEDAAEPAQHDPMNTETITNVSTATTSSTILTTSFNILTNSTKQMPNVTAINDIMAGCISGAIITIVIIIIVIMARTKRLRQQTGNIAHFRYLLGKVDQLHN